MNIWYAVYVKGQTTDQPAALFKYGDSAAKYVDDHYKDRAEVKPVVLNASIRAVTLHEITHLK